MKWPTNVGYAIAALERLFYDTALVLADGDRSRIHFTYRDLGSGPPRSLPPEFTNVSQLDATDASQTTQERLAALLNRHRADFALTFDVQPIHPLFRVMRRNGVRTILSYWGAPISSPMPAWKLALKRAQIVLSRSKVDGLVFESRAMADLAHFGRGVPAHMIDIVPLGVDVTRYRPQPSDYVYRTFGIPRERKVVVFSGHCTPRKGIDTLIRAAVELLSVRKRSDVYFLLCGNQGQESQPYEAIYEGLGIQSWIRFAGYRTDLLPIFQSSYCGVLPSSGWDSFTLSSVEMAATGLPIVASRLQGLAEAVLDGETGLLVEPGHVTELADRLEQLLDDPEAARRFGRAARARCERELTVELQKERLLRAIRRHINGAAGADDAH